METIKEKNFEKKQELIEAAIDEFSENGYDNASLNNILKVAGMSKGAFYYHFNNKEELYFYLISILIEEKKNYFASYIKAEDFNKNIFELLRVMTEAGLKFAKINPKISRFSKSFIKERNSEIYNKILERYPLENTEYFGVLIENAYVKGEIRQDIPKEFTKHLISYLFTNIQDIVDIKNVDDFEPALYYLLEILKNGLSK